MLNLHCNNNDKREHKKIIKNMGLPGFEPGLYGCNAHQGIHYAMEVNAIYR